MSDVRPGQRWAFTHYDIPFTIDVTELVLDGDVVHGTLVGGLGPFGALTVGTPGDLVIVPLGSVESGHQVLTGTACNSRPKAGHPFYGTLVACHLHVGHVEPHSWDLDRTGQASSYICPICRTESMHPDDVANGYCGHCHAFTREVNDG